MLKNWNFSRVLRMVLGVYLIGDGIQSEQWVFVAVGALFLAMAVFKFGCCSTTGCETPISKTTDSSTEKEIVYEEVK